MSQALAEKFHATGVHKTDESFKYSYEIIDSNEYGKAKINEPPCGKTNNVVSEQVRHKPTCTSTEKS